MQYNNGGMMGGQPQQTVQMGGQQQMMNGQPMMQNQNMQGGMMQQGGMMMQQPMQMQQVVVVQQGFPPAEQQIMSTPAVLIKQKFELGEAVFGCEMENRYNVSLANLITERKFGRSFLYCRERSKCCDRMCLDGNCRPFTMEMFDKNTQIVSNEPMLEMRRECACTFGCLNRPVAQVYYRGSGAYGIAKGTNIGQITVPYKCFDKNLMVYKNVNGQMIQRYEINGDCCQLGFFCKAPCESCQNIHFQTKIPGSETPLEGAVVDKKSAGCLESMMGDQDNFFISWPMDPQNPSHNADLQDRLLLLAAGIMMDFAFFEERPGENKHEGF